VSGRRWGLRAGVGGGGGGMATDEVIGGWGGGWRRTLGSGITEALMASGPRGGGWGRRRPDGGVGWSAEGEAARELRRPSRVGFLVAAGVRRKQRNSPKKLAWW
jgi:hypothetical protein